VPIFASLARFREFGFPTRKCTSHLTLWMEYMLPFGSKSHSTGDFLRMKTKLPVSMETFSEVMGAHKLDVLI
jgi:hypothetical protein